MVKPETFKEAKRNQPFIAEERLIVGFAENVFDSGYKMVKGKNESIQVSQGVNNLEECKNDIDLIFKTFERYGFTSSK